MKTTLLFSIFFIIFTMCSKTNGEEEVIPKVSFETTIPITNPVLSPDGGETTVSFTTNVAWTAQCSTDWMSASPSSGQSGSNTIKLRTSSNNSTSSRTGILTITAKDKSAKMTIVQEGVETSLSLSSNSLEFTNSSGNKAVEVASNSDWTVQSSDQEWCTVSPSSGSKDGSFSVSVIENTGYQSRTATITVVAESVSKVVAVTQDCDKIFTLSPNSFTVEPEGEDIVVNLKTNQNYEITFPETPWINLISKTGEYDITLKFGVEKNNSTNARTGVIAICADNKCYNVVVQQKPAEDDSWKSENFYHHALAMRFTATWCGYCPNVARNISTVQSKYPDKIEVVNFHGGGSDLWFDKIEPLMTQYNITGYPTGVMDGRGNVYSERAIEGVMLETEANYPTVTGAAFSSSISGTTLTVNMKIYAKKADNYKITVIVLEDGIVGYQADNTYGWIDDYVHNATARLALTDVKGDNMNITTDGSVWTKKYTATIPSGYNKDNLRILVYVHRSYGSQPRVTGVSSAKYENYGDYYIDNSRSGKVGTTVLLATDSGAGGGINDDITIGNPVGAPENRSKINEWRK